MRKFIPVAQLELINPRRVEWQRAYDRKRPSRYKPIEVLSDEKKEEVRARERERQRKKREAYIARDRAKYMWLNVRLEAKRKGVEFSLTVEWFRERLRAGVCEMSGVPFNFDDRKRNNPSIDRKAAGGHYTADNCRMILFSLNQAMSNYGEDYIVGVFRQVIERRGG